MITLAKVPVQTVLDWIDLGVSRAIVVDKSGNGWSVKIRKSQRLQVFSKSLTCIKCSRRGAYFLVEQHVPHETPHLNLYSNDGTLMTKDHIIPKSKGGKDYMRNYQTMCAPCNEAKRNIVENEKIR